MGVWVGKFDFANFNRNLIFDASLYFGYFSGFFRVGDVTKEVKVGDGWDECGVVGYSLDAFFPGLVGGVIS